MTRTDSPLVDHAKQGSKSSKENAPRKSKKKSSLSKKERLERNAKGWMEGLRETYMQPLVNEYADAQMRGQKAEKLKMNEILRKFHFWFPYPLADHEEPKEMKAYDPHYVEPEGSAEFEAVKGAHLQKYNKRVKAWIMSRLVKKEGKRETKVSKQALAEPFTILMAKLAGLTKPPRAHSAQQQWQIANWTTGLQVEKAAIKEWSLKRGVLSEANGAEADSLGAEADDEEGEDTAPPPTLPRSLDAGTYPPIDFVGTVSRRMFATLPAEERAQWKRNAQEESRIEKEAYEKHMSEPLGSSPTSRATCVRNAPEFISKLNRGIEQASSLRLMTLAAGPMARKQGDVGFFMVTTSTNHGAVPMSFQEWYGEEKTKELMDAYKEWTESCLTPSEVQEVLGKASSEELVPNERYTGMLGKGFTTDDVAADLGKGKGRRRERLLVPTGMSPPSVEGMERTKSGKNHSKPAEGRKPRTLRKKAGEDSASDDSSSDDGGEDTDKWSEKSSSEDSAMDTDDRNNSDENNDTDVGGVAAVVKRKREEQKEARRRKKARAGEKPSRRSARMLDLVQKDSLQTDVDAGAGEGDSGNHEMDIDQDTSGATKGDGDQHQVRPDVERLGALSRTPSPPPPDTNNLREQSKAPSPPPPDTNDRALSKTPTPPPPDTNDLRARELLVVSFPYISIGLEKGTFCVADGLGSLTGFLLCGRRGLDFLLLPLNEFLQAKGGDHLKVAMERLIAIEIALLDGNIRDDAGRKKAVVPVSTRPKVLSGWIGYGRCRVGKSGAPVPRRVIGADALGEFGKTWRTWWAGLQPEWRVRLESDDGWERSTYGEDWHSLTIPGQNGLLSVIATLSWWGSAVIEATNGRGEWLEAVSDVEWMLAGLLGALEKRRA